MKQLTCEMCGSTNLMKQDGVFVCQSCGIKYSVEEAKKLMIEGTVEVAGTVKVDDTAKIANYQTMAENAYDADNKQEAESYCNKIIEIDPTNYKAWLLKGRAAGWQSTLARLRIDEAVNCFTKAVDNAPEDKVEEIKAVAAKETTTLTSALITMCCNNFAELPTASNAKNVIDAAVLMKRIALTLLIKCGAKADDLSKSLATTINNSAMNAWNNEVYPDYAGEEHPSKYTWERFVERGDAVISMLKAAVALCDDDDAADAVRYSNLIAVETKICDSASYRYDSTWHWQIEYQLNASAKSDRNQMIMEWHKAWNNIDSTHIVPSAEAISNQTDAKAKQEASSNSCVCVATIIIVIVAIVWGFLS